MVVETTMAEEAVRRGACRRNRMYGALIAFTFWSPRYNQNFEFGIGLNFEISIRGIFQYQRPDLQFQIPQFQRKCWRS